jgi:hypothetical protein
MVRENTALLERYGDCGGLGLWYWSPYLYCRPEQEGEKFQLAPDFLHVLAESVPLLPRTLNNHINHLIRTAPVRTMSRIQTVHLHLPLPLRLLQDHNKRFLPLRTNN